jgi:hypothetical protein
MALRQGEYIFLVVPLRSPPGAEGLVSHCVGPSAAVLIAWRH